MVIIIDLLFQHPSSCEEVIQENQELNIHHSLAQEFLNGIICTWVKLEKKSSQVEEKQNNKRSFTK